MQKITLEVAIDVGENRDGFFISTGRYEGDHMPEIGETIDVYVSLENSGEELQTGNLVEIKD